MSVSRPPPCRRPIALGLFIAFTALPLANSQTPATSGSSCLSAAAEAAVRQREGVMLGPKHAADHAQTRARHCEAERAGSPPRGPLAAPADTLREDLAIMAVADELERGVRTKATRAAQNDAANAKNLGRWSTPFRLPVLGVTSVVLHTGKVLFWSYEPSTYKNPAGPNTGVAMLFDYTDRSGRTITPPENIWCAGQTILSDGRVFLAGGNLRYPDPNAPAGTTGWMGAFSTYTFDPTSLSFTQQPDMKEGRWYPTTTKLADNRVVISSGYDQTGSQTQSRVVEVFDPATGLLANVGTQTSPNLYPHQFTMPSRQMLDIGPVNGTSQLLTPGGDWVWSPGPPMQTYRYGGNGISYTDASSSPVRQSIVMLGGEVSAARNTAQWLDGFNPGAGWKPFPAWQRARFNSNTVILPDGSMLTIGGGAGTGQYDSPVYDVELYPRPATDASGSWRGVARATLSATYHSTAVLLPDATVLLSEDDREPMADHRGQVYSPPYLFKGARPVIRGLSTTEVGYGQTLNITTDRAVTSAVLIAPGATTHANDMHQRAVKLPVTVSGTTLTATVPNSSGILPPGYYMLFVLDSSGIPSVSSFVRVG